MKSRVVGKTSTGRRVTGTFTPLHVAKKHGDLMVKGIVQGVVREASGRTSTFTAVRSLPVRSIGGQQLSRGAVASAVSGRAACDILHLVLGPLDLDLLGLQVHLSRVVLDIVAVTGAGNLLGNLLCAITGLLDGTPIAGRAARSDRRAAQPDPGRAGTGRLIEGLARFRPGGSIPVYRTPRYAT